ncbi:MAG: hypothetical protein H6709_24135, partial [Kofleriaceae bacterium]|nr:hypothetical protein [Kofleriaceae bacterium]
MTAGPATTVRYRFVEVATVTAAALERAVNHGVGDGWRLDDIRFVVAGGARRPTMAFVSFVRDDEPGAGHDAGHDPAAAGHGGAARVARGHDHDRRHGAGLLVGRASVIELGELD